jgi:hypothetical protein
MVSGRQKWKYAPTTTDIPVPLNRSTTVARRAAVTTTFDRSRRTNVPGSGVSGRNTLYRESPRRAARRTCAPSFRRFWWPVAVTAPSAGATLKTAPIWRAVSFFMSSSTCPYVFVVRLIDERPNSCIAGERLGRPAALRRCGAGHEIGTAGGSPSLLDVGFGGRSDRGSSSCQARRAR